MKVFPITPKLVGVGGAVLVCALGLRSSLLTVADKIDSWSYKGWSSNTRSYEWLLRHSVEIGLPLATWLLCYIAAPLLMIGVLRLVFAGKPLYILLMIGNVVVASIMTEVFGFVSVDILGYFSDWGSNPAISECVPLVYFLIVPFFAYACFDLTAGSFEDMIRPPYIQTVVALEAAPPPPAVIAPPPVIFNNILD